MSQTAAMFTRCGERIRCIIKSHRWHATILLPAAPNSASALLKKCKQFVRFEQSHYYKLPTGIPTIRYEL
eukprot:8210777-Pyramimonas_sp.AAC.1